MKVIWISPEMPYPANTGGRIGIMKRLEYFGINNEIYFYCIVDSKDDFKYKSNLLQHCKDVHLYNRSDSRLKNLFKSLYVGPYACASRINDAMSMDINNKFEENLIDFVIVDFPQMLGVLNENIWDSGKVILNQHNIEYITMHNLSESIRNPFLKMLFRIESKRLKKWEEKYYRKNKIRLFTFVSIEDKTYFENTYHVDNTLLVPVGAEVYEYNESVSDGHNIAYFGKMAYPPNAEAAKWFAEEIFVNIQKKYPNSKFYIVGKDPLPFLLELQKNNPNVIVTGTVDDVAPYYNHANLIVVPLSHGGGVKVKLLEGLGRGKLMLSTAKGMEGTIFRPNVDLLAADTAEGMYELAIAAFEDSYQFETIRRTGYNRVKENFSWKSVISSFENYLLKLI